MRTIIPLLGLLVLVAAAPATRPDTPAVAQARQDLDAARKACLDRLHATEGYKVAQAKADEAMNALEEARANGTPEQKLSASSEYNRAAAVGKKMEGDALTEDEGVKAARTAVDMAELRAEEKARRIADDADRAAKAAADREANDPVKKAIREHRLIKGMTVADAIQMMGGKPKEERLDSDGRQVMLWTPPLSWGGWRIIIVYFNEHHQVEDFTIQTHEEPPPTGLQ